MISAIRPPSSSPLRVPSAPSEAPPDTVGPGIALDAPWKKAVYAFANDNLQHTAWGVQHAERDYMVARDLASREGLAVDDDVLFAAAFLHDMGGFPSFEQKGVDHAVRSAAIVGDAVLKPAGFPSEKIVAVQQAILHHSYYDPARPETPEGLALHDADALDFLGAISVARIVSVTGREAAAPDLSGAVRTCEALLKGAPSALYLTASQPIGEARAAEMRGVLDALRAESFDGKAL